MHALFVCAVALFAAVVGDFTVESISNAQLVWHGNYTDRSSLDLLPVFLLALTILLATQGSWLWNQAREAGSSARTLMLSTSRAMRPREIVRLLPAIVAVQLAVLFCMETAEQFVVFGHGLGGTIWLGGPLTASLLIHAVVAVIAAFTLARGLGAACAALTRIVRCIFTRFVTCAPPAIVAATRRVVCPPDVRVRSALVERGPPTALAPS